MLHASVLVQVNSSCVWVTSEDARENLARQGSREEQTTRIVVCPSHPSLTQNYRVSEDGDYAFGEIQKVQFRQQALF
jgi:hypothetical protein